MFNDNITFDLRGIPEAGTAELPDGGYDAVITDVTSGNSKTDGKPWMRIAWTITEPEFAARKIRATQLLSWNVAVATRSTHLLESLLGAPLPRENGLSAASIAKGLMGCAAHINVQSKTYNGSASLEVKSLSMISPSLNQDVLTASDTSDEPEGEITNFSRRRR